MHGKFHKKRLLADITISLLTHAPLVADENTHSKISLSEQPEVFYETPHARQPSIAKLLCHLE